MQVANKLNRVTFSPSPGSEKKIAKIQKIITPKIAANCTKSNTIFLEQRTVIPLQHCDKVAKSFLFSMSSIVSGFDRINVVFREYKEDSVIKQSNVHCPICFREATREICFVIYTTYYESKFMVKKKLKFSMCDYGCEGIMNTRLKMGDVKKID